MIKRVWNDGSGQGLPEYALLIVAIAVIVMAATLVFREHVQTLLNTIGGYIEVTGTRTPNGG